MNRRLFSSLPAILTAMAFTTACQAAGVYTLGHGDVRAYYDGGELKLRYQLDYDSVVDGVEVGTFETGPESFGLNELVTYIPDIPVALPPGLPAYDFLGATAGDPLWYVPEVQENDRPWLGFSTQELSIDDWVGVPVGTIPNWGMLRLDLMSVSGPPGGHFSLFQTGPGGEPFILFATSEDIGSIPEFATSTHAHASWFFTRPGFYDVTLKFSGTHVVDGYKEAIGTVRFAVAVPEPVGIVLSITGLAVLVGARNRW